VKRLLLAISITAFATTARADPAGDALFAKAADCIRANAGEVAAKSRDLMDATQFLVNGVCVVEISHVDNYAANLRTLTGWQAKNSSSQLAGVSLDPITGDLVTPPGFSLPFDAGSSYLTDLHHSSPSTALRAIAAHAVLDAKPSSR
jgi:hypothetical protein